MNSLFFSIIYKKFSFWSAISLSISRIHYEFTVCFGNSFWINYLFREFTLNPISVSWVRHLFRRKCHEFTIFFSNLQFIHYLYRFTIFLTMNLLFFREYTMNLLLFTITHESFINFEFTILFANIPRIHHLLRLFTFLNPIECIVFTCRTLIKCLFSSKNFFFEFFKTITPHIFTITMRSYIHKSTRLDPR